MRERGFTLIELLAGLAITAVLLFAGASGMLRLVHEVRAEADIRSVAAAVQFARATAVTSGVTTTICPIDSQGRCHGNWSQGFVVFQDPERSAILPAGSSVIRRFEVNGADSRLTFRAFGSNRFLRFLPNGQTAWQNGRFEYCPEDARVRPRVLVINVQGRARMLHADAASGGGSAGANRAADCS